MLKNKCQFFSIPIFCLSLFLTGCIDRSIIYHVQNHGKIFLTGENFYGNETPPFNHPYKISDKTIASMMSSMECNGKKVFSDKEVEEFAPQINKAFLKADSNSLISFYISENAVRDISGGEIWIKGDKCYWFFYPSSEIYLRSPVTDERIDCLNNKKYEISITLPGT
ncbi:MAG: hypothetical protein A3C43_09080 [Candidatus Schekmanbacteria bacterium RIFCSPHIGHO2_02_FULL_38_11]|uniref:Lipoprotein n=1 Tax=Candidatus Schekmanbacteria bacterium RIFCSPLOWO2_12_FULL_38_15 TaxID=1817883 RepID=A0A1F7SM90_9BACT|nr:MAG: hypothetical protein A3H37_04315 [Candidatus Schekmanbacteria bacterium RIFCSPLOWO2_02_FULL_38_14]OGL49173.1 MAG: hypothetical protein A3C43_09080 [Candidatus Schekmanbacteria bacterium RIFCSPHIGHO2_02_FULL_38_11]OGL54324.1 MAG: hypothetical protein A3G31_12000 [Candidatus Schekmanbacteria bacterium RIFCSPLOWO2_12_FULL_38_15]